MEQYFDGFDPLPLHENGFELFKEGKPYISLYHDCRLDEFEYSLDGDIVLSLTKVHDSSYGPLLGSKIMLTIKSASILHIRGSDEANFEDVSELTLLKADKDMELNLVVGPMMFTIKAASIKLTTESE